MYIFAVTRTSPLGYGKLPFSLYSRMWNGFTVKCSQHVRSNQHPAGIVQSTCPLHLTNWIVLRILYVFLSPMHRLWSSRSLYGFTSLEQWNEISYSHERRGPICMAGFCCVVCLQRCVASVSRLSVDCRRTGVGSTGNNFEEIGRGRVDILCLNLRRRTVENYGHMNQDSRCPGQDSNWALPETGL